jgi:hypothetical protein
MGITRLACGARLRGSQRQAGHVGAHQVLGSANTLGLVEARCQLIDLAQELGEEPRSGVRGDLVVGVLRVLGVSTKSSAKAPLLRR